MSGDRKYRLDVGVQQALEAVLPSLPSLVDAWLERVRHGGVDHQFREIAVALGWITSRDSRVREVKARAKADDQVHMSSTSAQKKS